MQAKSTMVGAVICSCLITVAGEGQKRHARVLRDPHQMLYSAAKDAFGRAAERMDDGALLFEPAELDSEKALDAYKEQAENNQQRSRAAGLAYCNMELKDRRGYLQDMVADNERIDDLSAEDTLQAGAEYRAEKAADDKRLEAATGAITSCVDMTVPTMSTIGLLTEEGQQ